MVGMVFKEEFKEVDVERDSNLEEVRVSLWEVCEHWIVDFVKRWSR